MDTIRTIKIKNKHLQRIHNNLRQILIKAVLKRCSELQKNGQKKDRDKLWFSFIKSILKCDICYSKTSDMVYFPKWERWFCVSCAEKRGWIREPESIPQLIMTRAQVRHFLISLEDILARKTCRTDHHYA
ncbi:MAG: hypothetical protein EU541_07205 [Promethearchaeota archaeon]|nr:MAG: hypothetical protein EU541_07205 [Candidatus Lokiarchaeota archaeon]